MTEVLSATELFVPDAFTDTDKIIEELDTIGAASRPLLTEETRQRLIEEAELLEWSSSSRFDSANVPTAKDTYWGKFLASFHGNLREKCPSLYVKCLARGLYRYKQGQKKEEHSDIDFTYIINIDGDGTLHVYDVVGSRLKNRVNLDTSPGTIIYLDGAKRPGTKRSNTKQHGIDNIETGRLSLVMY